MNLTQAMQMIGQFRNNPQIMLQRYGIPQNLTTPDEVANYLVSNGRVTREQLNQFKSMFNSGAQR